MDDTPLELALDRVRTHQSEQTRHYLLGYVTAKLEDGEDFVAMVPEVYVDDILVLVQGRADAEVTPRPPNEFTVRFWRVAVVVRRSQTPELPWTALAS